MSRTCGGRHRQAHGMLTAISLRLKIIHGDDYTGVPLYVRRCRSCKGWYVTSRRFRVFDFKGRAP